MRIQRIGKYLLATLVLAFTLPVSAGPIVIGHTGGISFSNYYGGSTGDVVGFRFTADTSLTLTHLGILNDPSDGTLDAAHQVGIWRNSDQALLGSVSVDSSDMLLDGYYYAALASVVNLSAGTAYTLGATYTGSDTDFYLSGPSTLSLDGVSNTVGVYPSATSLGFVYPINDSGNLARLGPNALFLNAVPVPGSIFLLGLGLVGLGWSRRKKS